ncbi:adhesion G-protein coupled receptor F3-like [Thunnus maccoyii]|uniref:adhesion G-protein coupled receptor F3-like n=1 Tax=Thunnus maccoyii TaxID=8240 RepID=UPI001C4B5131|nr:adhesion G-protein coupled receptor F3-like [Thunnus maccoyii]
MDSRVFKFLIGALYIYCQVLAERANDNNNKETSFHFRNILSYMSTIHDANNGELMVESNVTLEAETILSALNSTDMQVKDTNSTPHDVTLLDSGLISECLIVGNQSNCNCSDGYTWSNDVCYTEKCCSESTCTQKVSHITPLCIAKVQVKINGSVMLSKSTWDSSKTTKLETAFKELNGFEFLNVTRQRPGNSIVDFEAAVSVKVETSRLQSIVSQLETSLAAVIWVDTVGMVTIEAPETTKYLSSPILKCTLEEETDSAGWNMSKKHERFELNNGTVVKLNERCATQEYRSCVSVKLQGVTILWEGIYECGFTNGSVRHTAKKQLRVSFLPDEITLRINPLAVDCSDRKDSENVNVNVTATILNSIESFDVWWSYRGKGKNNLVNTSDGDYLVYSFTANISCQKSNVSQYVTVTFKNTVNQNKSAHVDIPVIYNGETFCEKDEFWPNTPSGDTVINRTCEEGRVGYKSRTCNGVIWQDVFFYCVDQELKKVTKSADHFQKGLGATQKVAMDIFAGLQNSSMADSTNSSSIMADLGASINILSVMSSASVNIALQESVLPDFVNAASNMLNKTWDMYNTSVKQNLSSNYLLSVQDLVKNIKVNMTNEFNSPNLDLKFCSGSSCSVFDIDVNLNKTHGKMRTVAVKNLTDKLNNNFQEKITTSLLLSVTLEDNYDSSLEIRMNFPSEEGIKPLCVFWNTTMREWSDEGCFFNISDGNHTLCVCNHLSIFSVLMSKSDEYDEILHIISVVGLCVSICALLIFLIIEALVWSAVVKTNLSHFRHTAMVNIALFLLLGDSSFLASSYPDILSDTWCLVLTICKHLFFLAMFCWMLCLSGILVHQLIFVFSPVRKRAFMLFSSIVGYVCPILIVGSSYVYYKCTDKPYHDKKKCWLLFKKPLEGSLHAFILPVGTVILTNLFSMVVVILTLLKSSVPDSSKADDKKTVKSILKVAVCLTPVFGVTWVIGFFDFTLNEKDPMIKVARYSFTILNSFQGLFILLMGCLTEEKVREEMIKLIMAKSKGQNGSKKKLNSTTYTKDK